MNASRNLLLATATFAGGLAAGLLLASEPGQQFRSLIVRRTQRPARWVEHQLHVVETQLEGLEHQLASTSQQFGTRLREVTERAVGRYVPNWPPDEDAWSVNGAEVMRDLRRMPRS